MCDFIFSFPLLIRFVKLYLFNYEYLKYNIPYYPTKEAIECYMNTHAGLPDFKILDLPKGLPIKHLYKFKDIYSPTCPGNVWPPQTNSTSTLPVSGAETGDVKQDPPVTNSPLPTGNRTYLLDPLDKQQSSPTQLGEFTGRVNIVPWLKKNPRPLLLPEQQKYPIRPDKSKHFKKKWQ